MDDELYEQWVSRLTLRDDEAFMPGEHVPRVYRPKARNEAERRERIREQSREHMRRSRARQRAQRAS